MHRPCHPIKQSLSYGSIIGFWDLQYGYQLSQTPALDINILIHGQICMLLSPPSQSGRVNVMTRLWLFVSRITHRVMANFHEMWGTEVLIKFC